jgi:hypothetical protein
MGNYFLHLRLSTMLMTMMMAIDGNDDGEWIEVFRLVAEFDASSGLRGIQLHPRLKYYDCDCDYRQETSTAAAARV